MTTQPTSLFAPADTSSSSSTSSSSTNNNTDELSGNDFMQLLVAQLKNQDPSNPMDPSQFVTQLVQFNSLEQLIDINGELAPASTSSTGSGASGGSSTGTGGTSATSASN